MRICGVTLSGSAAIFSIVEKQEDGSIVRIPDHTTRIEIGDDKDVNAIRAFHRAITTFSQQYNIQTFAIKSRAQRGQLAGGAVSFKMEALIQLVDGCECEFINPVALSRAITRDPIAMPNNLFAYQSDSYKCAVYCARTK